MLDPVTGLPKLKLAIAGLQLDGWYALGKIKIVEQPSAVQSHVSSLIRPPV
jgi:hypothetical protein